MKLLFKQAIKSLFANKIFTFVMMVIMFFSGGTYTLFQSTAASFRGSFNALVKQGNLNDALIKEKYAINGTFKLVSSPEISGKSVVDLDKFWNKDHTKYQAIIEWDKTLSSGDYAAWLQKNWADTSVLINPTQNPVEDWNKLVEAINNEIQTQTSWVNSKVVSEMSVDFSTAMDCIYGNELHTANTRSLAVLLQNSAYKVVTSNTIDPANDFSNTSASGIYDKPNPHDVNKLTMYDGTNLFTQVLTDDQKEQELKYQAELKNIPWDPTKINKTKGYKWSIQSDAGYSASVVDPSSFEAVVSPAYANQNNKLSIDPQAVLDLYTDGTIDKMSTDQQLRDKYAQNMVWVDTTPYFIIGIGTTPDFAFPIVDQTLPTPSVKNQAIVFTNRSGYEAIYDGFRTAPNENYISLKFNPGISQVRQNQIKAQIEEIARTGSSALSKFGISYSGIIPTMSWPQNIQIVTNYNDINDPILLEGQRVSFLEKLSNTLNWLSIMTTTMLVVFVSAIVILVFSALIATKRKTMATLISLGYAKKKIAFSTATVSLLIGALPSALGYVVGHFLQYSFINMFTNFWTIPAYGQTFSWVSIIVIVSVPIIFLFFLIFLISLFELRHNLNDMLKNSIIHYNIAPSIMKHMKYNGIKSKYSISLIISNFWKLLLIALTSIISVTALMIGFSSIGRATYAFDATKALTNYSYKIDLYSPTKEGGAYTQTNYDDLYSLDVEPTYAPTSIVDTSKVHWHVPSIGDAHLANLPTLSTDPNDLPKIAHYLENKLQTKALLDANINGANPWDIAKELMPENQQNKADDNYLKFWLNPKDLPEFLPGTNDINPNFVDYFRARLYSAPNDLTNPVYPYVISYKTVLTNNTDETYTYIDSQFTNLGTTYKYHITGYKPNTNFLNIPKDLTSTLIQHENDVNKPILINNYIAEEIGAKVGTSITMNIENNVDRFQNKTPEQQTFVVRGIVNSFDNNGIFTLQDIANNVIGLNSSNFPHSQLFNGVFTKEANPVILNSLPLYSPSGIYIATDTISGGWETVLQNIINAKLLNNDSVHNIQDFYAIYTRTPLVGSFDSIIWNFINEYAFQNISHLSADLILIIQTISIVLSILFTIIVSSLFIDSNKRSIGTLWTLGYRRKEIIRIFLSTFIFPGILTLLVSIPITIGIVVAMRLFIMHFGQILIPFAFVWWMPIVAISIIGAIFIFSIIISTQRLKGTIALEAFKEE